MTELEFQSQVGKFAKMQGWLVYHTHDSRLSEPGFPDLVLVKGGVLFRELKSETGRISFHQQKWGERLQAAGADWAVWRPSELNTIYEELMQR